MSDLREVTYAQNVPSAHLNIIIHPSSRQRVHVFNLPIVLFQNYCVPQHEVSQQSLRIGTTVQL